MASIPPEWVVLVPSESTNTIDGLVSTLFSPHTVSGFSSTCDTGGFIRVMNSACCSSEPSEGSGTPMNVTSGT